MSPLPVETAADTKYMRPLRLAGQLIMENGGETFRAEETIVRMGHAFGLDEVESFAVPSGLFLSYRRLDGSTETGVYRVRRAGTNLTRVDEVNRISRAVADGKMDCEAATTALEAIRGERSAGHAAAKIFMAGVCAGGFCLMFGGGLTDTLTAALVTALVQALTLLLERFHLQALVATLSGALLSALLPLLCARLYPARIDAVIAGSLMPLLPGLAMTNAVQDTMRGDMVSGLSHGIQAILTAGLVAGGALIAQNLI